MQHRHVGRERRLAHAQVLQAHSGVEVVEQALATAEHDRRDRDRQLLHVSGAQRLTDHVRPAHDEHVLAAGRLARLGDRLSSPSTKLNRAPEAPPAVGGSR
jgi:hypothetical protein